MPILYIVQGRYAGYWEDVTAEESGKEAQRRLREYDENEPQYRHRVITAVMRDESINPKG